MEWAFPCDTCHCFAQLPFKMVPQDAVLIIKGIEPRKGDVIDTAQEACRAYNQQLKTMIFLPIKSLSNFLGKGVHNVCNVVFSNSKEFILCEKIIIQNDLLAYYNERCTYWVEYACPLNRLLHTQSTYHPHSTVPPWQFVRNPCYHISVVIPTIGQD